MISKTVCITQEGPANALALNKDNSQVVIAGRNVFKIFTLLEDRFEEACNLRVGKNLNLNFSCNDVAWNLIDDHILATAATNGAVVVWNLNKSSRSKQEHVFIDHKRTVNKVSFHMTEPMWLISGSQDGTMKCFDLRIKEATRTFYSNTESVRDVQFCPHSPHTFAAVSENGHVQQWDLRKPDRYFQHFTAHSGPIFACDWHPETAWLATASRDKTIKVWDLLGKPSCDYIIHTIASVGRIKWRPQRKYHISSCALVVDCSINVWDIRRPYIPFASFNEHKDVPTGVAWRGNPQSFLSTSRDCTLYHHVFKDATRPASKANPQGIALNPKGDIVYACKVNVHVTTTMKQLTNIMRKTPATNDTFCMASSVMHRFAINMPREPKWFRACAEGYLLSGRLNDICDHNAIVARNAGRNDISTVWNIIKTLYANPLGAILKTPPTASKEDIVNTLNLAQITIGSGIDQSNTVHENDVKSLQGEVTGATSGGDDETETDETPENQHSIGSMLPSYRRAFIDHKGPSKGDFLFGESEFEPTTMEYTSSYMHNMINNDNDWTLSKEAFPLRHEIKDRSPPPEQFPNHPPDINEDCASLMIEDQPSQLIVSNIPKPQFWDPTNLIEEALKHHAALRDIQTSASILIALGEKRKNLNIETAVQEHWILEYLDMLARFKLWNVATQIIQSVWIPSVSQLNQQSTVIHTCCLACSKPLQRAAWFCDRCHTSHHALCSVCHQVVRGIYAWCQGCTHGGHVVHMNEWFSCNRQCPTGCGHICEYT
ncbi:GATOR complex protein WDR24 [Bombus vosnesenskii]|uniref:GATOR2 complex protein WDR24 n=4 Tax=Pyrobombus TaxID=144703 RepID=A0A6J3L875_9HYME|nr:GATOR complex protein WDR24 [Bombus impatiens]XP_033199518.1 GATOR complex protein WDR24 [Bombus vancouverensis nearcticus]XP_033318182.1 GATOR complex protein WDR24 [Bombus bifarius]XP_033361828.1 GATOR complex protein WDR24 [Bombus vosnesenskii]XP_050491076.1 GATOR complex protein WDR24 isoform X1 [Bombus huntii]